MSDGDILEIVRVDSSHHCGGLRSVCTLANHPRRGNVSVGNLQLAAAGIGWRTGGLGSSLCPLLPAANFFSLAL